jgi:YaiO family outer membrane protein
MRRICIYLFLFFGFNLIAQNKLSSDELFSKAKEAAFNKSNRELARQICKSILIQSPNYADVSIFLGRLYTWDSLYDSARVVFYEVIKREPSNSDAISATIDLEYWSGDSKAALEFCNLGVAKFPYSTDFLLKKAKVLDDLKDYDEAFSTLDKLFKINNSNSEAIIFAERLKEKVRKNSISLTYEYNKFDKTFDPWQLSSLSYSRLTPIGTTIFRMNLSRRFGENGTQFEVDMYPRFGNGIYSYLNFGYSKNDIFPKQRYGASLYLSLPWSLEIDGGFRVLKYSSDVWIYTAALGKYISNYWFSFRTFITPQIAKASHSYSLTIRYYPSDVDNYLSLTLGTGISPDGSSVDLLGNWLKSDKVGMEYQVKLSRILLFNLSGDYSREEILPGEFRQKFSGGIGFKFLF